MQRKISKLVGSATALLTVGAVARELRLPRSDRAWHGRVLGVPYDFRRPTLERLRAAWWSPNDDRLIMPRTFGLGWAVNIGRIGRLAGR